MGIIVKRQGGKKGVAEKDPREHITSSTSGWMGAHTLTADIITGDFTYRKY